MKKIFVLIFSLISISSASVSAACVDLQSNLSRGAESERVLLFQNFLFEKGYLKATPNGYFGPGTFAAVKAYQKGLGLSQVGVIGPATRAALKKDSCGENKTPTPTTPVTVPVQKDPTKATTTTIKPVVVEEVKTPAAIRNAKRRTDSEVLLKALAKHFSDSRGVHPVYVTDKPIELCVKPVFKMSTATATEVAVLATPVSPCATYVDVSYLAPTYIPTIPRDPAIATTSILTGYMITRNEYNDITIEPKTVEDKAIIKATCNFSTGCTKVEQISTVVYSKPSITSLSNPIFLQGSSPKVPITITGKGLTLKNKVYLSSGYNSKEYFLGEFSSADGLTIPITATSVNQLFPCGSGCNQKLSLGDYAVSVRNEGGSSNLLYLSIKGYTSSSFSARSDTSVTPKTTNVKLGTITISSSIPLNLLSLTLKSTTTKTNLPGKLSKFVLKDPLTNTSINASGLTFNLTGQSLYENQSKLYDVYADVAEVLVQDSGFISYGGTFLAKDVLLGKEVELPVKEFSFTVSY